MHSSNHLRSLVRGHLDARFAAGVETGATVVQTARIFAYATVGQAAGVFALHGRVGARGGRALRDLLSPFLLTIGVLPAA